MPQGKFSPDAIGDWGTPAAAEGGRYMTDTLALPGGGKLFMRAWLSAVAAADARRKTPRLAGIVVVNPGMAVAWKIPVGRQLRITAGGLRGSRRPWSVAPGAEAMTANAEAAGMLAADTYWVRQQTARFL